MTVTFVSGDPLLTRARALAIGHNARGRIEVGTMETDFYTQFPTAFAAYRRKCQSGRIKAGEYWAWSQGMPHLYFIVGRDTSVGATRMRYVQNAMMTIARDYNLLGLTSLAIAPLGDAIEWREIIPIITYWLSMISLPVVVYEAYLPDVRADEPF